MTDKHGRLRELKKANPRVNETQAAEVLKTVEVVRAQGVRMREYSLRSPFRGRIGGPPVNRLGARRRVAAS